MYWKLMQQEGTSEIRSWDGWKINKYLTLGFDIGRVKVITPGP